MIQTLKNLVFILQIFLLYSIISISCVLMLHIILGYSFFEDDVQFLLLKKNYIDNRVWKSAFYIHVFSAVIALFAGFTQFSKDFLKNHKRLHRIFGKVVTPSMV